MINIILALLFQPSGFVINVDANETAVYVIKYNNKIVIPGKEVEIFLIASTEIEITTVYLDKLEEITKKVKIKVEPGYTYKYTFRIRSFPEYVKI